MPKKLDLLHYILMGLLLGSVILFNSPFKKEHSKNVSEEKSATLLTENPGDTQPYDEGYSTYKTSDSTSKTPPLDPSISQAPTLSYLENKELHEVTQIVKGILQITNFDGAEIDYIGEVKEGKAHGFGFAIFEKKGFYEGEWVNNRRNGEGIYYWKNGDIYEGHYLAGFRTGYGIYTFATGDIYKGNWKDNFRHGEGVLYNKRGKIVSSGPWIQDEPILKKRTKKKR